MSAKALSCICDSDGGDDDDDDDDGGSAVRLIVILRIGKRGRRRLEPPLRNSKLMEAVMRADLFGLAQDWLKSVCQSQEAHFGQPP